MKLISVKDSLGREYSGEFNSIREAYEYYQDELNYNKITISKAYLELPEIKKFAEWYLVIKSAVDKIVIGCDMFFQIGKTGHIYQEIQSQKAVSPFFHKAFHDYLIS